MNAKSIGCTLVPFYSENEMTSIELKLIFKTPNGKIMNTGESAPVNREYFKSSHHATDIDAIKRHSN